jgi:hypothetical protein
MNSVNVIQTIQAILAPALLISSCGLMLLALNNRFSNIIGRIRLLGSEKRKLAEMLIKEGDLDYHQNVRIQSVEKQLGQLLKRCRLVRNAILCKIAGVTMAVLTSLFIALAYFFNMELFQHFALDVFVLGMLFVGVGVIFFGTEVVIGYKIAEFEMKAE